MPFFASLSPARMPDTTAPTCARHNDGIAREIASARREQPGLPQHVAPLAVGAVLSDAGRPLDHETRGAMEARFGHDFSRVRIHSDDAAAASAEELGALAYAAGPHVVFNRGQFRPETAAGRALLAHELAHSIQHGDAATPAIQPKMKLELQTTNPIWRGTKKPEKKLPRKFGSDDMPFVHQGATGTPSTPGTEGDVIELQAESGGFVEFETSSWHDDWCELKGRIQEAVDMVGTINKATIWKTFGTVDVVKWPFPTTHLAKTSKFRKGLGSGEELFVELQDRDWHARIQASESFALSQFENYLGEHGDPTAGALTSVAAVTANADAILGAINTKKLPAAAVAKLRNLLLIVVHTISSIKRWNTDAKSLAKENIELMSRTNFASMYRHLLSADEQQMWKDMVSGEVLLKRFGDDKKTMLFPKSYKGLKAPGPTIHAWLVSIHTQGDAAVAAKAAAEPHDLLSSQGGDNRAIGRFDVNPKNNLVRFEARSTSGHNAQRRKAFPPGGWAAFAEEVFKAAATNRPRAGKTAMVYHPKKCP